MCHQYSCSRKFAAIIARIRVLAPEDPLRGLEGLLEGGRGIGYLLGSRVRIFSKSPRIAPLKVERDWMIRSKNAIGQWNLVANEGPGFGEFAGGDDATARRFANEEAVAVALRGAGC